MKVGEILKVENIIYGFERRNPETGKYIFITEDGIRPFKYAFLRNKLKMKSISEEKEKIIEFLRDTYEGDKADDLAFQKFVEGSNEFKEFVDSEKEDFKFYTIKIDSLEGTDFDEGLAQMLIGTLITE